MRNNYFRVIFVIIVIGLIVFAAYYLNKKDEVAPSNDINELIQTNTEEITNVRLSISNIDNLNPILSKNQNVQDICKLIFEPLLKVTEDYKLENCLATEWSKAGEKVILIKLREGVKWHNGNDFSARDVKYTIEKIKEMGNDSIYFSNVQKIDSVEIVGNSIIKLLLSEDEPFFEYNLTFPIISAAFYGEDDIRDTEKNKIPMGTGMYKIKAVDFNKQIELKDNPNWWNIQNIKPKIKKIVIKIYSSISEAYNAYKLGSIDMITTMKINNIEENIGTIGYNIRETYGREFDFIALNTEGNAMMNIEVRQAINYAINRQDIINSVYNGKYIEADYPLSYGSYLYNKESSNYEYNPDRAKQILVDNGWTYTNKYWQKKINNSYVRLKLSLLVNSYNGQRADVANKIKEQLENIGIQVNVISVKDRTYDNYVSNKNYDMFLTGVTVGLSPDLNKYFGEDNFANYTNEDAKSILSDVRNISDENMLKEKFNTLQSIYQDDRAYIGLYFNKITTVFSKSLSGTVSPTWYNLFYNIETWYRKR